MADRNHEEEAREWNKTAGFGYTCKACRRIFFARDAQQHGQTWTENDGEPWLLEVRLECPDCQELRSYKPNDLQLHQWTDDGVRP